MNINIKNGRVLLNGSEWAETSVNIAKDKLSFGDDSEDTQSADIQIDAENLLVLPGIVDLHGDAFERQLMPRPGVHFGHESALLETDNQMIANGITTAYHGLTYSWEPGLRGSEAAQEFVKVLTDMQPKLRVDTRLHLRYETYNIAAEEEILGWMQQGKVDLLAFNDHIEDIEKKVHKPEKLSVYAGRTGLQAEEFLELLRSIKAVADQVPATVERMAAVAREHNIPMASHDDVSPESRSYYQQMGCQICEFPINMETARYSYENENPIIMGAPNVMRGGSHCGRLSAVDSIAEGFCNILTSDYYYPTLALAAFKLANDNVVPLADAWNLVSKNPAMAANKTDRGVLAEDKRADVLLIDTSNPELPVVKAAIVAGELQHTQNLNDRLVIK